jgi:hypothetical protein
MPPSRQWTCPACRASLTLEDLKDPPVDCPHCGVTIGFSSVPLLLALCFTQVVPLVASLFGSPLKIEPGSSAKGSSSYKSTLRLFLSFWFGLVLFAVVHGFFTGWIVALLGAPRDDVAATTDFWSIPLGMINPSFVIKPEKGLAEVLGIVTANCYFNALALTIVFKVVHGFLRRSRVTQLGISSVTLDDDDEL